MSNITTKTELAETPADGDLLYIVDVSDESDNANGSDKHVTRANLVGGLQAEPSEGAFADGDKTKLDGIEASATANPSAIDSVVEDISPQLGGDLDVNGSAITSASNGDIELTPNGTGAVVVTDAKGFKTTYVRANGNISNTIQIEALGGTTGGDVLIDAGSGTTGDGGDVKLRPKGSTSGGSNGKTVFVKPITGQEVGLDLSAVASNRTITMPNSDVDLGDIGSQEGTAILSTGETGGSKFLREDGDGTSSWQAISGGGDMLAANNLSDVANAATARTNLGVDAAGTDNSTDVTLAGTGTYLSLTGQAITVDPITESDISDLGSYKTAGADETANVAAASTTASGKIELATQTETNTGTDTSRAVTPSTLANYTGLGASAIDDLSDVDTDKSKTPADGDILTFDGTDWNAEAAAGGGGGGNPYGADIVVPTDYTTLGEAIVAASANDVIYVEAGTHTETADRAGTVKVNVIGNRSATIDLDAYDITLAAGSTVSGISVAKTGVGYFLTNSANVTFQDMRFVSTNSGGYCIQSQSSAHRMRVINCEFYSSLAGGAKNMIMVQGDYSQVLGCSFDTVNTAAFSGVVALYGEYDTVDNCIISMSSPLDNHFSVYATGSDAKVTNNTFIGHAIAVKATGSNSTVSTNQFTGNRQYGYAITITTSHCNVTNNTIYNDQVNTESITITAARNIIQGNFIRGSGASGSVGVRIEGSDWYNSIVNNYIYNLATGITITGGGNALVMGNYTQNCTTEITDSGTDTMSATATDSDPLNQSS